MARHASRPHSTHVHAAPPKRRKKQPEPKPRPEPEPAEEEDLPVEEPDEPHPPPEPGEVKEPEQPVPQQSAPAWSNDPQPGTVPHDLDTEMKTPTTRERQIAALAQSNSSGPRQYDIRSKNEKATRIVYDYNGRTITVHPGQTKWKVWLYPQTAQQLNSGDLEVKPSGS